MVGDPSHIIEIATHDGGFIVLRDVLGDHHQFRIAFRRLVVELWIGRRGVQEVRAHLATRWQRHACVDRRNVRFNEVFDTTIGKRQT